VADSSVGRAPKNILVHTLPEKADELGLSPVKPEVAGSNPALPPFIFAHNASFKWLPYAASVFEAFRSLMFTAQGVGTT